MQQKHLSRGESLPISSSPFLPIPFLLPCSPHPHCLHGRSAVFPAQPDDLGWKAGVFWVSRNCFLWQEAKCLWCASVLLFRGTGNTCGPTQWWQWRLGSFGCIFLLVYVLRIAGTVKSLRPLQSVADSEIWLIHEWNLMTPWGLFSSLWMWKIRGFLQAWFQLLPLKKQWRSFQGPGRAWYCRDSSSGSGHNCQGKILPPLLWHYKTWHQSVLLAVGRRSWSWTS